MKFLAPFEQHRKQNVNDIMRRPENDCHTSEERCQRYVCRYRCVIHHSAKVRNTHYSFFEGFCKCDSTLGVVCDTDHIWLAYSSVKSSVTKVISLKPLLKLGTESARMYAVMTSRHQTTQPCFTWSSSPLSKLICRIWAMTLMSG
jgi:hypothetical protein